MTLTVGPGLKVTLGKPKILVLCCRSGFNFSEADNHPSGALRGVHPEQDYMHCSGRRKAVVLF